MGTDQVEFADVFETLVETLDKDLNQVEDPEFGLGLVHDKDKVEGRVVSVDYADVLAANQGGSLQEIAQGRRSVADETEDFAEEALLNNCRYLGVEFRETWFAIVVDYREGSE